jgi:uncharacterized membrane protein
MGQDRKIQWEGPVGLGLIALFFLLGLPLLLFASVMEIGPGHVLLVAITTAGLWIASSGLRRGDRANRALSAFVLLFFLLVIVLLYNRGRGFH